ncbi:hypothetical protein JQN72_04070 [Phycicoccus sp. CSK15P-2]|uniref:diacylglycerol/lipid kinase family protein n=1 Tax=Phycicoccus sp. CSK15P-2 TaxID=2807627 RepID=UPI00194E4F6E|nr:diacylglycerol kinase family protein [Phycicoccus sp. CSK15P-2]MBM6403419.1 hypothetical protein [Phycicoccus sp. CSK15P-2]
MSGETWTWIGVGIAVALGALGLFLLASSQEEGRHARPGRPRRDVFRRHGEEAPARKRVAVVVNPVKFEDLDAVRETLAKVCDEHGWDEPLVLETTEHDVGFGQTREALEQGVDLVCALGGDGTVRAVGEELVGSGTPFGLLPGGTGNLLARNLELPVDDIGKALAVALTGRNRHMDAAWMTLDPEDLDLEDGAGENSTSGERRHAFFVMAGVGLDAAIMDSTSEQLKKRIGWTAYVPAGLKNMFADRFTATLTVDDGTPEKKRSRMVVIGNCGRITGGIDLMPEAEPDDGTLDVIVLGPRGPGAWASVVARVVTKHNGTDKALERYRCQSVGVEVDERQRVQVDGDIIGEASRLRVEIEPRSLIVRTASGRAAG